MRVDGVAGPGCYRCGCGARVALSGLPKRDEKRCPMPRGNRVCNGPKLEDRPLCEPCMISVADEALRIPGLAEELGERRGVAELKRRKYDREQQLIEAWREHNASRA